MPKLYQRKGSKRTEYSDHYIRSYVDGRTITYQVLREGLRRIQKRYPRLPIWSLPKDGVDLEIGFVIRLRQDGHLKTKKELARRKRLAFA